MPVLTTPRRITLYWLLLLLPTLAVGLGALMLLRREQARIAEQSAYAIESRRAAVADRARLIVENVELLVGDVQSGLLDTIAAEPVATLDAFLDQWEQNNPLVRTGFRATVAGRLLRPNANSRDEDARGFQRRFGQSFSAEPPWKLPSLAENDESNTTQEKKQKLEEPLTRKDAAQNVAQVQSARRDVQELLRTQPYSNQGVAMAPSAAESNRSRPAAEARGSGVREQSALSDRSLASSDTSDVRSRTEAGAAARNSAPAAPAKASDTAVERRGWLPWNLDGRMHLLGWVQPAPGGDVRGVELELAALISRLGGVMPAEAGAGEGYVLRDQQGRVLHQVGLVPREGEPATRVPLAASLIPGWEVAAFLTVGAARTDANGGFFWVGALLVGIFVVAILAGGSLLLWQARRSEAEAAQKTSFVANVSHEFKTPLTTIRLYAELLETGRVRDAAQGGDYLRTIGRETQRLARLVNNALDFSRLEQGKKKYARDQVDLTTELARLTATHAPRLAEAGLELKRELPPGALGVTTDRDAVEQIVLNLLDNACKYAAGGAEATVTLLPRARGGAEVRVSDRGPGVPVEHRERIFEKFHRVDDALTAEKSGTGLGLSIARQLARGLGGELRYSARAGGGAEFILELP